MYHESLEGCATLFRIVFGWLNQPRNYFDDPMMFESHLLLCGLIHRDITNAVFDHDVDEDEEPAPKPLFVRNSIFKLANRDGLEEVLKRIESSIPRVVVHPQPTTSVTPPVDCEESVTAALRPARPKPKIGRAHV